jgi:ABC-2 type transport system ATP-binding protein
VTRVQIDKGHTHVTATIEVASGRDIRNQIAGAIVQRGWALYELRGVSLSLEDIFLELTTEDAAHAANSKES